jgi:hypothetical protein
VVTNNTHHRSEVLLRRKERSKEEMQDARYKNMPECSWEWCVGEKGETEREREKERERERGRERQRETEKEKNIKQN